MTTKKQKYNVAQFQTQVEDGMGKRICVVLGEKMSWQNAVELRKQNKGAWIYKTPTPIKKKKTTKKT